MNRRRKRSVVWWMGRGTWRIGLLGALMLGAGFVLWWLNEVFSLSRWSIEADASLQSAIDGKLRAMTDRSFLATRPSVLRRQWLSEIPDLAEVRIARVLPDTLLVWAKARTPIALWQDELGAIHLLDENGVAYRKLARGESPDLPLLRVTADELSQARELLLALARVDQRRVAELSEVHGSEDAWALYFSKGERWWIPKRRELFVLKRLSALLTQPRWRKRRWRIDARMANRWFIRPAKPEGVA